MSMELVKLSIPNNKLVFDSIYLNGLHALHRIKLKNNSDSTVLVKFKSNLGSQIAFQLSNENLIHEVDEYLVTNTVMAAFDSARKGTGHLFNQLFNYVNHVDSVSILPESDITLIISFLPDVVRKKEELLDFFDINGLLFFFCYKVKENQESPDYQVFYLISN
jgi:hypothetical protein